jgi:hypothetical protein
MPTVNTMSLNELQKKLRKTMYVAFLLTSLVITEIRYAVPVSSARRHYMQCRGVLT